MRQEIAANGLVAPYDPARVVNGAYELSLGSEVYVTSPESETKRQLVEGEQVPIPPGQFANLLTQEKVTVPAEALGLISVRFRLKQRGLVNVSGFHVDPGYSGHLLFSVFNAGPQPVVIARGEPVFLLWFASFDDATEDDDLYAGRARDTITSADVMQLQGEIATPQALASRVAELERWRARSGKIVVVVAAALLSGIVALVLAPLRSAMEDDTPATTTTVVTTTIASTTTSATPPASRGVTTTTN